MQQPVISRVTAPSDLSQTSIAIVIGNQVFGVPAIELADAFGFMPSSANLVSWAAITRAAGFDTFVATPSSANLRALLTDETGTGAAYFAGGNIGTPSAGVATNLTGLPISTGVSGLGSGIATFLATPTSANLAAALTDESGTGVVPFIEIGNFNSAVVLEGTTTAGVGTYSVKIGRYSKIGNRVLFTVALVWSAHTGTGNMRIAGLPFTAGADAPVQFYYSNLSFTTPPFALVGGGGTTITLAQAASGAAAGLVPMDTAATLICSGVYEV